MRSKITIAAAAVLLPALALLLSGCAGTAAQPEQGSAEASASMKSEAAEQSFAITGDYDLQSLLLPVLQLNLFRESVDYFGQFAREGDWIFPDYLFKIFWMGSGLYLEGQGTVVSARTPQGELDFRLSRALVEALPDGSKWWQIRQEQGGRQLFYEVKVSDLNTLEAIRYADPDTGAYHEFIPHQAEEVKQALATMSAEELRAAIQQDADRELDRFRQYMFHQPQILGEETIEVGAGDFPAVHVQDRLGEEEVTIRVDYWLSPAVPGGILKFAYTNPEETQRWVTELSELTRGHNREILDSELTSTGGFGQEQMLESEGSPDQPVEVLIGEPHRGGVGPEQTSYYRLVVDRQSDISVEVSEFAGDAELFYYGQDATFQDWVTSSQGATMHIEDYLVPAGTSLYFSVVDYADEYGQGESYTINVDQSFILDSTGIMMRGDIYEQAKALQSGRSQTDFLEPDGLNYYKVTVASGDTLMIQATGLSEYAALSWFDTENGSYNSAYTSSDERGQRLEVSGLEPGTVCYFYISGDIEMIGDQTRIQITVAEK